MATETDGWPEGHMWRGWPVVMAGILVVMGVGMFWESWAFYHDLLPPLETIFCWAWAYLLAAVAAGMFVKMQERGEDEFFPEISDLFLDRPLLTGVRRRWLRAGVGRGLGLVFG